MEKVERQLIEGVAALWNFLKMIEEVCTALKLPNRRSLIAEGVGFYLYNNEAWVGIVWETPAIFEFTTEELQFQRLDGEKLGRGEIVDITYNRPCRLRWEDEIDLNSEEVNFFDRSHESQLQFIEQSLRRWCGDLEKLRNKPIVLSNP
jgi:hypothetical protein